VGYPHQVIHHLFVYSIEQGLNRQVYFSHGTGDAAQNFEIMSGEGVKDIAKNLEERQLIKNDFYFNYFVWKTKAREKLQAGKYEIRGSMTIPEIEAKTIPTTPRTTEATPKLLSCETIDAFTSSFFILC